jgi:DNA-binding IscR family transcriptional regulator
LSFIDLHVTRSNHKIAYGLILQHILVLKAQGYTGQINASEIASDLKIPYKTVYTVMHDLHNQGFISNLKQY